MPVFEFAIGMGPKLFSKKINGTVYSVRMLPLGGFVNIGGMQPEEFDMEEFRKEKIDEITKDLKEDLEIAEIEISDDEFVERAERRLNIEMEEELEDVYKRQEQNIKQIKKFRLQECRYLGEEVL